jgi:hypothetical protein
MMLNIDVKLEGGPCDQLIKTIESADTHTLRFSVPVDQHVYTSRYYLYGKTTMHDENGLPIFLFYLATDGDDIE